MLILFVRFGALFLGLATFFFSTVEVQADIRGISLKTPVNVALDKAVDESSVKLRYTLMDSERKILGYDYFNADLGEGRLFGRTNVTDEIPDTAIYICFAFSDELLNSLLVIVRPCEVLAATSIEDNGQFLAKRGLDLRVNLFSILSKDLSDKIKNFTSTEEVLLQREKEFFNLLENPFTLKHSRAVGWLVRDLLKKSAPMGRLVKIDYFGIHREDFSDVSDRIRYAILGDRSISGGTNVSKEILLAMQEINLNQYSFGRSSFLSNYWSSLRFLYETYATIMRENGNNGSKAGKGFATYCSQNIGSDEHANCLTSFSDSSELLLEADPSYSTRPNSDLMVTMQILVRATGCDPEEHEYSRELFDRQLIAICGNDKHRCKRYFPDMYACYELTGVE